MGLGPVRVNPRYDPIRGFVSEIDIDRTHFVCSTLQRGEGVFWAFVVEYSGRKKKKGVAIVRMGLDFPFRPYMLANWEEIFVDLVRRHFGSSA